MPSSASASSIPLAAALLNTVARMPVSASDRKAVDMVAVPPAALPWLAAIVVGYALAVRLIVPAYTRVSVRGGLTGGR